MGSLATRQMLPERTQTNIPTVHHQPLHYQDCAVQEEEPVLERNNK